VKIQASQFLGLIAFGVLMTVFVLSDFGRQNPLGFLNAVDVPPGAENIELDGGLELEQGITTDIQPQDEIFVDFEANWRKFISPREELTLEVVTQDSDVTWKPLIFSECVFSEGAGAYVPAMTLTWIERSPVSDNAPVRFDVTTHYQGFQRDFYATIFPVAAEQRFNLPSNSALVTNTEAVLLTGPALFPKVVEFSQTSLSTGPQTAPQAEPQTEPQTGPVAQATAIGGFQYQLKVQDLGPGLAYKIRKCDLVQSEWRTDQLATFSTPVCAQKF